VAATATRWRLATDNWLLLRAEEKLRAEGLRRAKAYRVESAGA
jgi:hypothetical protein